MARIIKYGLIAVMAGAVGYYCYQLGLTKGFLRGYVWGYWTAVGAATEAHK